MVNFKTEIKATGCTSAVIHSEGNGVTVDVPEGLIWDATGLLALAEAIRGAAAMLSSRQPVRV